MSLLMVFVTLFSTTTAYADTLKEYKTFDDIYADHTFVEYTGENPFFKVSIANSPTNVALFTLTPKNTGGYIIKTSWGGTPVSYSFIMLKKHPSEVSDFSDFLAMYMNYGDVKADSFKTNGVYLTAGTKYYVVATVETKEDSTLTITECTHPKGFKKKTVAATVWEKGTTANVCPDCGEYHNFKRIDKKLPALKKTTAVKKGFKASWKKISGANGYQIQYSIKKSFKSAKKVTVKGGKSVSKKVLKLKSKKKYYVRIRAYKTVNGKKVYTKWSKAKTVKIK